MDIKRKKYFISKFFCELCPLIFLPQTFHSLSRLFFLPPHKQEDDSEDIDEEGGAEGDFLHAHAGKYPEKDERYH